MTSRAVRSRLSRRTALAVGSVALAVAGPAGCAVPGTHPDALPPAPRGRAAVRHTVVYRVTGPGTASALSYLDGGPAQVTRTDVPLPWSTTLRLPAGGRSRALSLVVDFAEVGGVPHRDSITVDGRVVTRGAVGGDGPGHSALTGVLGG